MSADVVPLRKDRYEALIRARDEFEGHIYGAIKIAQQVDVDPELMRQLMLGVMNRIMTDLEYDQVQFEPEEPA